MFVYVFVTGQQFFQPKSIDIINTHQQSNTFATGFLSFFHMKNDRRYPLQRSIVQPKMAIVLSLQRFDSFENGVPPPLVSCLDIIWR